MVRGSHSWELSRHRVERAKGREAGHELRETTALGGGTQAQNSIQAAPESFEMRVLIFFLPLRTPLAMVGTTESRRKNAGS